MYHVEFTPTAAEDLARLNKPIAQRVRPHLTVVDLKVGSPTLFCVLTVAKVGNLRHIGARNHSHCGAISTNHG